MNRRRNVRVFPGMVTLKNARRLAFLSILLFGGWAVAPVLVHAQVSFSWPPDEPDVRSYSSTEDCLAAVKRLHRLGRRVTRDSEDVKNAQYDTGTALPPMAVNAARRCSEKFSIDDMIARDSMRYFSMSNSYQLFLQAGRVQDALNFVERWLESIPPSNDTLRNTVVSAMASLSIRGTPRVFDASWLLAEKITMPKFWETRLRVVGSYFENAVYLQRSDDALKAADWLAGASEIVGDSIASTNSWSNPRRGAGTYVFGALQYLKKQELMDSLQQSSGAYLSYLKKLYTGAKLQGALEQQNASPVQAHYWFLREPLVPLPSKGVVTAVVTGTGNDCIDCVGTVAVVQRLKEQFPSVEFVMLFRTLGFHGLVIEPPSPEVEAALIDSVYRKIHHVPATIGVYRTEFWRIPEYDRRRINQRRPNDENYPAILDMRGQERPTVYLIDRDNRMIKKLVLWRPNENEIRMILNALVKQGQSVMRTEN